MIRDAAAASSRRLRYQRCATMEESRPFPIFQGSESLSNYGPRRSGGFQPPRQISTLRNYDGTYATMEESRPFPIFQGSESLSNYGPRRSGGFQPPPQISTLRNNGGTCATMEESWPFPIFQCSESLSNYGPRRSGGFLPPISDINVAQLWRHLRNYGGKPAFSDISVFRKLEQRWSAT